MLETRILNSEMLLWTLVSDSHRALFESHLKPTAPCEVRVVEVEQKGSGEFETPGFGEAMRAKYSMLYSAARGTEVFAHSDADVRFYGTEDLSSLLGDRDILFQCDLWQDSVVCDGLLVARPCNAVARLFADVAELGCGLPQLQGMLNAIVRGRALNWAFLPPRYWTAGAHRGELWKLGDPVYPPHDLAAHHANWTVGVENKLKLLQAVQEIRK